jgi:hypothetical protein
MPFTLSELAATLERNVGKTEALLSAELRVAGKVIQETAKEMIGHEHALWPPLKPATIEDKERRGYDTPAPCPGGCAAPTGNGRYTASGGLRLE